MDGRCDRAAAAAELSGDAAGAVRRLYDLREELEGLQEAIVGVVRTARAGGASWAAVGAALGVSKQGAQQRYGSLPVVTREELRRWADGSEEIPLLSE